MNSALWFLHSMNALYLFKDSLKMKVFAVYIFFPVQMLSDFKAHC